MGDAGFSNVNSTISNYLSNNTVSTGTVSTKNLLGKQGIVFQSVGEATPSIVSTVGEQSYENTKSWGSLYMQREAAQLPGATGGFNLYFLPPDGPTAELITSSPIGGGVLGATTLDPHGGANIYVNKTADNILQFRGLRVSEDVQNAIGLDAYVNLGPSAGEWVEFGLNQNAFLKGPKYAIQYNGGTGSSAITGTANYMVVNPEDTNLGTQKIALFELNAAGVPEVVLAGNGALVLKGGSEGTAGNFIKMKETAPPSPEDDYGSIWVQKGSTSPTASELYFIRDDGQVIALTAGLGGVTGPVQGATNLPGGVGGPFSSETATGILQFKNFQEGTNTVISSSTNSITIGVTAAEDTQIIFNDGGTLNGEDVLTWNGTSLSASNVIATGTGMRMPQLSVTNGATGATGYFMYCSNSGGVGAWEEITADHLPTIGLNQQVIFNDNGLLNGDAGLTYNKTLDRLTVLAPTLTGGPILIGGATAHIITTHGKIQTLSSSQKIISGDVTLAGRGGGLSRVSGVTGADWEDGYYGNPNSMIIPYCEFLPTEAGSAYTGLLRPGGGVILGNNYVGAGSYAAAFMATKVIPKGFVLLSAICYCDNVTAARWGIQSSDLVSGGTLPVDHLGALSTTFNNPVAFADVATQNPEGTKFLMLTFDANGDTANRFRGIAVSMKRI